MKQTCTMKLTVDSLELTVTPEQAKQLYNQLQKEFATANDVSSTKPEGEDYRKFTNIYAVWGYLNKHRINEYWVDYTAKFSKASTNPWGSNAVHHSNLSPELLKSALAHNKLLLLSQFFCGIINNANANVHWYYIQSSILNPTRRSIVCINKFHAAYCPFPTIEVARFVLEHYKQVFDDYFMFVVPESSSSEKS